jgi:uncharacterized membrane protein
VKASRQKGLLDDDDVRRRESDDARPRTSGSDRFGRLAERFVRLFGMPWFLASQTVVIAVWIVINVLGSTLHYDPYPFILLNLVFSALAAYAAPLILLAQTRQADRDKTRADIDTRHREQMAARQARLLQHDAAQTEQIAQLLAENRRQTDHITELLQQTRQLLERESDQTDLIASLASQTIETAQANHALTREIHAHTVMRDNQHEGQPNQARRAPTDQGPLRPESGPATPAPESDRARRRHGLPHE